MPQGETAIHLIRVFFSLIWSAGFTETSSNRCTSHANASTSSPFLISMGSGTSKISSDDSQALQLILQQETSILNQLVDNHQIRRPHAIAAIEAIKKISLFTLTTDECLKWIQANPDSIQFARQRTSNATFSSEQIQKIT